MAQTRGKEALLEGILNRDLAVICELSLMLEEGPDTRDWKATLTSRKKYLGRVNAGLLGRLVEFLNVYSKIKVPGRHADRLPMIPACLAEPLIAIELEDWGDDYDPGIKLGDCLEAEDSRLLLKWAIFDGLASPMPGSKSSAKKGSVTSPAKSKRRGDGSWRWFYAALSGVAGLDEVKRALYDEVYLPLVKPEMLKRYGLGSAGAVLMHGPPGVGKTAIARELAQQAGLEFRYVSAPALLSKWIGDTERGLRDAFARPKRGGRVLIFIDELDAVAPNRDSLMQGESVYVQQLLVLLDGFEERSDIAVIAATNRLEALDPAVIRSGRFRPIEVPLPDSETRAEILKIYLKERLTAPDLKLDFLIRECVECSGADIKALVDGAARIAMHREDEAGETQAITDADLGIALRGIKATRGTVDP